MSKILEKVVSAQLRFFVCFFAK